MRTIGVAEGSIIPTIIMVHITNMKAKVAGPHGVKDGCAISMPGMSAMMEDCPGGAIEIETI
jgi:hypothetical protein